MRLPNSLWRLIRLFLRAYWRVRRPITAGVRAAVFDGQDRVLLVRHRYMPGWFLPGGGVERHETMGQALARELEEEAGLTLLESPVLFGLYANFRDFKSDHVALYTVRRFTRRPHKSWEIAEAAFFSFEELPSGTTEATRLRIREVREGLPPADFW